MGEDRRHPADEAVTIAVSITQSNITTALRSFLLSILPAGTECVLGQVNRVSSPTSPNYVAMTPLMRTRLATNVHSYTNPTLVSDGSQSITQSTQVSVQLDVHGPAASDNAQIIMTLLRDDVACQFFKSSGFDIQPLYTSEPRQMPFVTGEDQYEDRWSIDAELQANPTITINQQFADTLDVGLVNIEATYG